MFDDLEKRQLLAELQEKMFRRRERVQLGRYVLAERIGSGAMGVVYRAEDPVLRREVAVKVLHPQRADVVAGHDRLRREARALGQVRHPNVIEVYDVGSVDDRVFVAMELVEGRSLEAWLAEAPRPWRAVLDVFVQAGRGLHAAHQVGLVHRDFKPGNVQVARDGTVRVLDFGLAKPIRMASSITSGDAGIAGHDAATVEGAVVGTPRYLAPAQLLGAPADAASDQYAFCVALWEALFGEPPFDPKEMLASKQARVRLRPTSSVPLRIQRALRRGLAPQASDRFGSMEALLAALQPRRSGIAVAIAALGIGAVAFVSWPRTAETPPAIEVRDEAALAEVRAQIAACDAEMDALRLDAAEALCTAASARAQQLGDGPLFAEAGLTHGRLLAQGDRVDEAIAMLEAAHGEAADRTRLAIALDLAGLEVQSRHDLAQGRRWAADARAVLERLDPDPRLQYGLAQIDAVLAHAEGDGAKALAAAREGVEFARAGWGAGSVKFVHALQALGVAALDQQRFDEARAALEEAIATGEKTLGPDHFLPAYCLSVLAGVDAMEAAGDPLLLERSVATARRAAAAMERAVGRDHFDAINARLTLGIALAEAGRNAEARDELQYAMRRLEDVRGPDTPGIAVAAESLGTVLAELGELDQAEATLHRAVIAMESIHGEDYPPLANTLTYLGDVQERRGAIDDARKSYERAVGLGPAAGAGSLAVALEHLAALERNAGRRDRAAELYDRAAAAWSELEGPESRHAEQARRLAHTSKPP